MTIIIPMAGFSQRFLNEGYTLPKYMLYAGQKSIFNLTISSFKKYFDNVKFLFVARDLYDTKYFIENECKLMGLINYEVIILEQPTRGQAETVFLGLSSNKISDTENILIFNIDTIRKNFIIPEDLLKYDGYLEVFNGNGKNWSYAEPYDKFSNKVKRTAEKEEISDLCSTGLYYFKKCKDFCDAFIENRKDFTNELYVAPLYNNLIKKGKEIYFHKIIQKDIVFTGIPSEYLALSKSIILDTNNSEI